jgi:hypothetical protein
MLLLPHATEPAEGKPLTHGRILLGWNAARQANAASTRLRGGENILKLRRKAFASLNAGKMPRPRSVGSDGKTMLSSQVVEIDYRRDRESVKRKNEKK